MTTVHKDNYNNTHKTATTIHTANQQQLHTIQLKTSNNTHKTNQNTYCKDIELDDASLFEDIFTKSVWTDWGESRSNA